MSGHSMEPTGVTMLSVEQWPVADYNQPNVSQYQARQQNTLVSMQSNFQQPRNHLQ